MCFEKFLNENMDSLMEAWDSYKYDVHYELFNPDNVDFYNEDLFLDMAEAIYNQEETL
jgi:hypothetical protein